MADPLRVVIVDDDADLRTLFRVLLECDGEFAVVGEAGDGIAALQVAAETAPDLVLLDLAMPAMDGLEALPLVCQIAPQAKVVVLTAFSEDAVEDKVRAAGAADYLVKGISQPDLISRLKAAAAG